MPPRVADESIDDVQLALLEDLALARPGPSYDELEDAVVARGRAEVVESLLQLRGAEVWHAGIVPRPVHGTRAGCGV
jgi:hypothetical protein